MKQDITPTQTQLPANFAEKLAAGIHESRISTVINAGGKPILRLLKGGRWVFGQTDEEVQDGSRWLINVASAGHGFVCWVDGSIQGESMGSVFDRKPDQPLAIGGNAFVDQRSYDMKCMDGDDAGTEVLYKVSSKSGVKEWHRVMDAIGARIAEQEKVYLFPVVRLKKDSYPHKKHGKIDTPIFEIVGWTDQNGVAEGAELRGEEALAPARGPGRPRKAPLEPTEDAPLTTQQAHATGRRRPGR